MGLLVICLLKAIETLVAISCVVVVGLLLLVAVSVVIVIGLLLVVVVVLGRPRLATRSLLAAIVRLPRFRGLVAKAGVVINRRRLCLLVEVVVAALVEVIVLICRLLVLVVIGLLLRVVSIVSLVLVHRLVVALHRCWWWRHLVLLLLYLLAKLVPWALLRRLRGLRHAEAGSVGVECGRIAVHAVSLRRGGAGRPCLGVCVERRCVRVHPTRAELDLMLTKS